MTTFDGKQLHLDTSDLTGMIDVMDRCDEFPGMIFGRTDDGSQISISVNSDNITTQVDQNNGWVVETVYYRDGTVESFPHR